MRAIPGAERGAQVLTPAGRPLLCAGPGGRLSPRRRAAGPRLRLWRAGGGVWSQAARARNPLTIPQPGPPPALYLRGFAGVAQPAVTPPPLYPSWETGDILFSRSGRHCPPPSPRPPPPRMRPAPPAAGAAGWAGGGQRGGTGGPASGGWGAGHVAAAAQWAGSFCRRPAGLRMLTEGVTRSRRPFELWSRGRCLHSLPLPVSARVGAAGPGPRGRGAAMRLGPR